MHARARLWCGLSGGIVCVFQHVSRETTNLHAPLCSAHVQRSGGHGTRPNDTSSGSCPLKLSHQELHTKMCQTGIMTSNACARTSPRVCENIPPHVREHPPMCVRTSPCVCENIPIVLCVNKVDVKVRNHFVGHCSGSQSKNRCHYIPPEEEPAICTLKFQPSPIITLRSPSSGSPGNSSGVPHPTSSII